MACTKVIKTSEMHYNFETLVLSGDACEVTDFWPTKEIEITSSHTGRVVKFILDKVVKDATGEDIIAWEYIPADDREPGLNVTRAIFFND